MSRGGPLRSDQEIAYTALIPELFTLETHMLDTDQKNVKPNPRLVSVCESKITCCRKDKLRLMNAASFITWPEAPAFFALSEPARSANTSLDARAFSEASALRRTSRWTVKMKWERDETLLRWVAARARAACAVKSTARASCSVAAGFFVRPCSVIQMFSDHELLCQN